MIATLTDKLDRLRKLIRAMPSALIAYSGGVDSAVVLAVAVEELGDKAQACIGVSPSYPQRERTMAVALAEQIGASYRLIATDELNDSRYAANPQNRCYFCKSNLFDHLQRIAQSEGWSTIFDGTNADDLTDDRPGRIAAGERGVRSPLLDAGLSKADVRDIAKELNLPVWDKPAMPCLASRVAHGTPIVPQLLSKIEKAEDVLAALGFRQFRVRHHGDLARLQLSATDLPRAMELRQQIVAGIRASGYSHVTLDLSDFSR